MGHYRVILVGLVDHFIGIVQTRLNRALSKAVPLAAGSYDPTSRSFPAIALIHSGL